MKTITPRRLRCGVLWLILSMQAACLHRDLDSLCQLAKDVVAEPRHAPSQRYEVWLAQVQQSWQTTRAASTLLETLQTLPPGQRYAEVQRYAQQAGHHRWKCPELAAVLEAANDP
jgi:hypothetical protein